MDNMLQHPWTELQLLIKEKWLTQKAFASILWKKVSEVNELLKWKRNITIQRDYLLHQTLWTPMKYWILKQVDYDYSLLNIEESSNFPLDKEGLGEIWSHPEQNSDDNFNPLWGWDAEGRGDWLQHQTRHSEAPAEESRINNLTSLDSSTSLRSSLNDNITQNENKSQETLIQKPKIKNEDDFKNRANIFKSF